MDSPLSTKAVILSALYDESGYGSDIIDRISRKTQERLRLHEGSVYPALYKLEDDGLIRRRKVSGHGKACFFELTRKGRDLARDWVEIIKLVMDLPCVEESSSLISMA